MTLLPLAIELNPQPILLSPGVGSEERAEHSHPLIRDFYGDWTLF